MKALNISLFICCVLTFNAALAQTSQAIEAGLLKSFKKIDYWDQKRDAAGANDSLEHANNLFARQLRATTQKYPGTITQSFKLLANAGLKIVTSPDS